MKEHQGKGKYVQIEMAHLLKRFESLVDDPTVYVNVNFKLWKMTHLEKRRTIVGLYRSDTGKGDRSFDSIQEAHEWLDEQQRDWLMG